MARITGVGLFGPGGDPYQIAAAIPIGSTIGRMRVKGHEYWVARIPARSGARPRKVYIGSDANKAVLEAAWAKVQAALDEAAGTPEGRRLRELQELAGGPPLARTSADSPLKLASGAGRGGGRRPKR